jgi:hypothetical protein
MMIGQAKDFVSSFLQDAHLQPEFQLSGSGERF